MTTPNPEPKAPLDAVMSETLYFWRVATRYPERKGTLCRVLVRGKLNSCLVEFINDGYRTVTSRNYVRKAAPSEPAREGEQTNGGG
jgi:hypothetical protein